MRKLKRVAWLCVAGCCCAGLMLLGGERSQGNATYCPAQFFGQYNGMYIYGCFSQDVNCMYPSMSYLGDGRMHQTGSCGTCPDPIVTTSHPLPLAPTESSLVPQPDAMFSGILR